MKLIGMLFALLALSACLKVTDAKLDEEPKKETLVEAVARLGYQIEGLSLPNQYQIHLSFPKSAEAAQRFEKGKPETIASLPLFLSEGVLKDNQVEAGRTYIYQIGIIAEGEFRILKSYEVTVPVDLLVNQEIKLNRDEYWNQFHRVFFTQAGIISLNGFRLIIQADQLLSEQGIIRTFPSGLQAAPQAPGRNGGLIRLHLRTAQGILKFEFRGECGGKGKDGASTEPSFLFSPQGEVGGDGQVGGSTGSGEIILSEKHELKPQVSFEIGMGGKGGAGGYGSFSVGNFLLNPQDANRPGPAPSGHDGLAGAKEVFCLTDLKGTICQ